MRVLFRQLKTQHEIFCETNKFMYTISNVYSIRGTSRDIAIKKPEINNIGTRNVAIIAKFEDLLQ